MTFIPNFTVVYRVVKPDNKVGLRSDERVYKVIDFSSSPVTVPEK